MMADKFDPDAFLKERRIRRDFNPDEFLVGPFAGARAAADGSMGAQFLDALGRKPAKDPGALRSIGSKLLQGFFKEGSDEAAGALTRMTVDPGVGWKDPSGNVRMLETEGDVYRAGRDAEREVLRGAEENHPWKSRIAQMAGDVASDAALGAFRVPVASKAYSTAVGAGSGLMGSDTDLTPDKATGRDVASAGLSTAVGGLLGRYLPDLAQAGLQRVTPPIMRGLRNALEKRALKSGRRALLAGADQLARVEPPTDDVVREAIESGAVMPFGTTKGAADRLNRLADEQGAAYGAVLDRLEELGVPGPQAGALIDQLEKRAEELTPTAGIANPEIPRVYSDVADRLGASLPEVEPEVPTAARSFLEELIASGVPREAAEALSRQSTKPVAQPATDLALGASETIKRALQDRVRYGLIEDTPLNEARAEVASMLRKGIEDRVEEAGRNAAPNSELDALAGAFMPVKERLSRTLGASTAANKGAAAAAKRGDFNLTDYLWAAAAGGGTGAGSGNTLGGALAAGAGLMGHKLLRERGPSTTAATSYALSQLMRKGVDNPRAVNREIGALTGRALTDDAAEKIAEWLRKGGRQ